MTLFYFVAATPLTLCLSYLVVKTSRCKNIDLINPPTFFNFMGDKSSHT